MSAKPEVNSEQYVPKTKTKYRFRSTSEEQGVPVGIW